LSKLTLCKIIFCMKVFSTTILFLCLVSSLFSQTFSNTTVAACNTWDSGNNYTGFTRNITVSGLSNPLATTGTVLRQVNIQLGTSACKGNLSTYYARLVSPSGTIIQLFGPFTSSGTSQWINIKFRDDASLERVSDYSSSVKSGYFPFDIGYYRTDVAGAFSNVNGEDPNGTWVLQIAENTTSEVSFERVELIFGSPIVVNDVTGSSANNDCSGVTCMDGTRVIRGTNNGYTVTDPNYPGNTVSGCSWNGNNNNSAWFEFTANATSAYLTVSGIFSDDGTPSSSDVQPIVVSRSGTDCSSGTFSVPTGGCPDDETRNNMSYLSSNGGGTSSGNVYFNGITANAEFNLSGLTIGNTYYLYIDGNGGASSSFYIEVVSGAAACSSLPVTLLNFSGEKENNNNKLLWTTATEINNDYFELERSYDALNFEKIVEVDGAGNSSNILNYYQFDFNFDRTKPVSYYRLKQLDFDGQYSYSNIVALDNDTKIGEILIYPNPATNYLNITNNKSEVTNYQIYSVEGKLIHQGEFMSTHKIDLNQYSSGTYLIKLISRNKVYQQKFIKE
jgi:hypothetical protein